MFSGPPGEGPVFQEDESFMKMNINFAQAVHESDQCPPALYQGTTSVVPKRRKMKAGFSPC